ncbi:hypothetical protein [Teredinibacter franksiae]|uniref:hypothetical protein n=1 Tax=Teredinibacter franksiae TaxID=2761453 RepID=UPI001624B628|nr:hypothetical protein [Teredinibacter franksiae]
MIEKENLLTRDDKATQNWKSGFWAISHEVADQLIGGDIFLHKTQNKPSFFGGKITGYSLQDEGQWKGRIIFEFTATKEHKNVKTSKSGWSMEKKIVK